MEFDITGFEGRVPDAAEVQSAHLSGVESAPYDDLGYATLTLDTPEELEALTGLHQSIVTHKEELEEVGWESTWSEDGSGLSIQSDGWTYVDISYTLMDGSYLTRKYRVPLSQSELDTPGTPAARLDALLNAPGLAGESYFHAQQEGDRLVDAWLTNPDTDSAIVPASALTGLEEAVRADLAEGTLGRRYLLENRDRLENCYYNDLYLEFRPGRTCRRRGGGRLHGLHHPPVRGPAHPGRTPGLRSGRHAGHPGPDSEGGRRLRPIHNGARLRKAGRFGKTRTAGFVFLKNLPLPIYQWLIF